MGDLSLGLILAPLGCRYPILTVLLIAYMVPYTDLCEQNGGWKNLIGRQAFFVRWIRSYFDVKLIKTAELSPKNTCVPELSSRP